MLFFYFVSFMSFHDFIFSRFFPDFEIPSNFSCIINSLPCSDFPYCLIQAFFQFWTFIPFSRQPQMILKSVYVFYFAAPNYAKLGQNERVLFFSFAAAHNNQRRDAAKSNPFFGPFKLLILCCTTNSKKWSSRDSRVEPDSRQGTPSVAILGRQEA